MPRKSNKQEEQDDFADDSDFDLLQLTARNSLTEQRHEVRLSDEIDYFSLD